MSYGHGSNRTTFGDGEEVASSDLTQTGLNSSQRAWEYPGYADLLAFDLFGGTYHGAFVPGGIGNRYARTRGVFTVGGGLQAMPGGSDFQSQLAAGFAGIWDESVVGLSDVNSAYAAMSWVALRNDPVWAPHHDAASAGNTRYDLVHCAVTRTSLAAPRNFEDAVTGQKTSATPNVAEQLALDIAVMKGTESIAIPIPPSIPSGRHALYIARVSDIGIQEIHDLVIPRGKLQTVECTAASSIFSLTGWGAITGAVSSSGAGVVYLLPPHGLSGNANALLLGCRVSHHLKSGDSVDLVSCNTGAGGGFASLASAVVAVDGSAHDELIDLRGLPGPATLGFAARRGHGALNRLDNVHGTLALKATSVGSGSVVYSVTWYYIAG